MMGVPVIYVPLNDMGSSALASNFQPAHPSAAKLTEDQVPSFREDAENAASAQELNLASNCLTPSSETLQQVGGSLALQSTQLLQPAVHLLHQGAFLNLPNSVRTSMASPGLQLPFVSNMNHNTMLSSAVPLTLNGSQIRQEIIPSLTQLKTSRAHNISGSLLLAEATQGPEGDASSSHNSHVHSSKHNFDCLPSQLQNAQVSSIQGNGNIVTSTDQSVITVSSQKNHVALLPFFSELLHPATISASSERHTQHPLTQIQEKYAKPNVISKKVSVGKVKKNHSKENYLRTLLTPTTLAEKNSVPLDSDSVNGEHNSSDTIPVTLPSQMHPDAKSNQASDPKAHKSRETEQTHEKNTVDMAANNYGVDGDDNEIVWLNKVVKVTPYCEIKNTAPCTCRCPRFNNGNFSRAVGGTCKGAANIAVEGDDDIIWLNRTIRGNPCCNFHNTNGSFWKQSPAGVIVLDDDNDDDVEILSAESVKSVPLPLSSDSHTASSKDSHVKINSESESLQGMPSAVLEVFFRKETGLVEQEGSKSESCLTSIDHTSGPYDANHDNSPRCRNVRSETENIQKQPPSAVPQIDSDPNTCIAEQEKQLAGNCSDHVAQHLEPVYSQMIDASFSINVQASILQPGGGSSKDLVSTCDAGDFVTPSATAGTSHLWEDSLPNSQLHSSFSDNDNLGFSISEVKTVTPDFNPLYELSSEGFYVCGYMLGECNFSTQFAAIFEMHLQKKHAMNKRFTCVHCGKIEESNKQAVDHLQKHLDQSRDMIHCIQTSCRYSCTSPEEFLGHIVLTHHDLPHPTCWSCHVTFTSLSHLVAHVKYNLVQMVHCVYCEAADTSIERILKHVEKHHAEGKRKYAVKRVLLCLERASNYCKNDSVLTGAENDSLIISEKQEGCLNASGAVPKVAEKLLETRESEPADSVNELDNIVDCETSVFEAVWIKEGSHQLENCIKNTIMATQCPMIEHELKAAHRDIQKSSKLSSKSLSSSKKQWTNNQEFAGEIQQKGDKLASGPKVTHPSRKQKAEKKSYQKTDMLSTSPMLTPSHEKQKTEDQKTANKEFQQKSDMLTLTSKLSSPTKKQKAKNISHQKSGMLSPPIKKRKTEDIIEKEFQRKRDIFTSRPKLTPANKKCEREDQEIEGKKFHQKSDMFTPSPKRTSSSKQKEKTKDQEMVVNRNQKSGELCSTSCCSYEKQELKVQEIEVKKVEQHSDNVAPKMSHLCKTVLEQNMGVQRGSPTTTLSISLSQLPLTRLRSKSESSQADSVSSAQTASSSENLTSPSKEIRYCCHSCPLTFTNRKQFFKHVHQHDLHKHSKDPTCSLLSTPAKYALTDMDSAHPQGTHDLKVEGIRKESNECTHYHEVKQDPDMSSSSCRKRSGVVEKDANSSHSKHRRPNETVHQKGDRTSCVSRYHVPNILKHSKKEPKESENYSVTINASVKAQELQKREASCGMNPSIQTGTVQPRSQNSKPKAFVKLKNYEKQKVLLSWLVSMSITKKAIDEDYIINEDDIHLTLEDIPHSCLDDNVNLSLVQHFFTTDAWKLINALVEIKKEEPWLCKCCERELKEQSVGCDSCLCWYHFQCAGLCRQPKEEFWFCKSCQNSCLLYNCHCFESKILGRIQDRLILIIAADNLPESQNMFMANQVQRLACAHWLKAKAAANLLEGMPH